MMTAVPTRHRVGESFPYTSNSDGRRMSNRRLPELPLKGGCQCGQLRYEVHVTPNTLYCCHCTECQAQASSAFGMSMRVPASGVKTTGREALFVRDGGSDRAVECVFCPDCGSRVIHRGRGDASDLSIKAGSLDDRAWLKPVGHIWMRSAQSWFQADGVTYETQPAADDDALDAAFRQQYGLEGSGSSRSSQSDRSR